jgi:hypothetical protein
MSYDHRAGKHLIPEHMWESVVAWIEHGEPHPKNMGTFLRHLLYNDLVGALIAADMVNALNIRNWAEFLHHYAPPYCYGSPEQVASWWQIRHPPKPEEAP